MSFKTPIVCDRRIYDKKGTWKSPKQDREEKIFYFIKEPLTYVSGYDSYGREEMKASITIVVFGSKPIIKEDMITLENGMKMKVVNPTINYFESNILVRDMLKPRIESMELVLE